MKIFITALYDLYLSKGNIVHIPLLPEVNGVFLTSYRSEGTVLLELDK